MFNHKRIQFYGDVHFRRNRVRRRFGRQGHLCCSIILSFARKTLHKKTVRHAAGRTASEIASYGFVEAVRNGDPEDPLTTVRGAYFEAHETIQSRVAEEPELAGMATTLVSLWLRGDCALLGHVGDSRIYLSRSGTLFPLTHDHSLVSEMVFRGQLTEEAARLHPHRHVITRALGVGTAPEPDTAELRLEPGDLFVLCSDGITGPITDGELCAYIDDAKGDLALAADTLIGLANDRGGEDNATVVLVAMT